MTFSSFFQPEFSDVILDLYRWYRRHSTFGSETCCVGPESEKNRNLHILEKNLKQSCNVH
jgi:hypothetical protein